MLPGGKQSTVTRDELSVLADIGEEEGEIEEDEEKVIQNLLKLKTEVLDPFITWWNKQDKQREWKRDKNYLYLNDSRPNCQLKYSLQNIEGFLLHSRQTLVNQVID